MCDVWFCGVVHTDTEHLKRLHVSYSYAERPHYEPVSRGNGEEEGGRVMCLLRLQQFSDSLAFYTNPKVNKGNSLQPIK